MKVLINAVSAKLGGAATYIRNLARTLPQISSDGDEFLFIVPTGLHLPSASSAIRTMESPAATSSYARRWWYDQVELRRIVEQERPDVLFSSANFAMMRCPCPQVLLVRNPIYFSREYLEYVLPRRGLALRAETVARRWMVSQSVAAVDCLMTPSHTMLADLRRYVRLRGQQTCVNSYGVPASRVMELPRPLREQAPLRLLWVSHYADHKNLATLLRAANLLKRSANFPFEISLTLDARGAGQHTAMPVEERDLLHSLGGLVRCLGVLSYEQTWRQYQEADLFIFPSLTESFGHPLVEAMASQLPIIASDISIHREICGPAARYFSPLDAAALAGEISHAAMSLATRQELAAAGRTRVRDFIWEDHVFRLLRALRQTAHGQAAQAA